MILELFSYLNPIQYCCAAAGLIRFSDVQGFFWLSLKMGIEVCFYDGMTGLASVTLQFVFPLYLYFLLLVIVLVSRWSSRFSRWQTIPAQLLATGIGYTPRARLLNH